MRRSLRDRQVAQNDTKKESVIRELTLIFTRLGYSVRREKLKQGHGWRVLSGACRAQQSRYIFVDRRLSQSDQVAFLLAKLADGLLPLEPQILEEISPSTVEIIQSVEVPAVASMAASS